MPRLPNNSMEPTRPAERLALARYLSWLAGGLISRPLGCPFLSDLSRVREVDHGATAAFIPRARSISCSSGEPCSRHTHLRKGQLLIDPYHRPGDRTGPTS